MQNRKLLIYPVIFAVVLAPVLIIALLTYKPSSGSCNCTAAAANVAPHSHGAALTSEVKDGLQLLMNVSPAAELYQVVDGKLQLCGGAQSGEDMKHVTIDVIDTQLNPGERLPVAVELTLKRHDTGETVLVAGAPAMYAPGHGYHYGDNYALPNDAAYDWTFTVSPVQALRQEGAQDLWLEPLTWEGSFTINADGTVAGKSAGVQPIGDFSQGGLHVMLGHQDAIPLYTVGEDGTTTPQDLEPGSTYFVVDVTDHAVNYEEKLPGAEVTLVFHRRDTEFEVPAQPTISPRYGFHYGANVALTEGKWRVTVRVAGLDFWRHAGAATSLGRSPIEGTFVYDAVVND